MNYGLKKQSLRKRIWDNRKNFSFKKTFGSIDISQLPPSYYLTSNILNQGNKPYCSSYSAAAVKESEHGIPFDPDDYYRLEGQENGSASDDGYDLKVLMQTMVDYGIKPLNANNPQDYKEGGYFQVEKDPDLFDGLRKALWVAKDEKKTAIGGLMWYNDYPAIISRPAKMPNGLHALKIAGWETIKEGKGDGTTDTIDVTYIVLQNSWGKNVGDMGLFYMTREMFNKEFTEGLYIWRTLPEQKEYIRQVGIIKQILGLMEEILNLMVKEVKNIF